MMRCGFLLCVALAAGAGRAVCADVKTGKVIEWGWGTPSPLYIREHVAEMEKLPFDGLGLDLPANAGPADTSGRFSWRVWGAERLRAADYSECIEALKETRFRRFTDNFLRFNVVPGRIDWFDEEFAGVVANAGLAARMARECRLKGILFDVEHYQGRPFHYPSQEGAGKRSFTEYQEKARERGREFMQALRAEYPKITVLLTCGYYIAFSGLRTGETPEKAGYGLLPAFLDGMLSAAGPKNLVFDGWESSYGYKSEKAFQEARGIMRERALQWTREPDGFRKHYRASFGLWVDNGGKVWDQEEFGRNYFTPEEFEYALHLALRHTDRYVWIYSHKARWWEGAVPHAYVAALRNARKPHPNPPPARGRFTEGGGPSTLLSAKTYPGADDAAIFGDLWGRYEEVLSLPREGWMFRMDPKDEGEKQRWFAVDVPDAELASDARHWKEIAIGEWWEPQGYAYDGVAWYRRWVDVPASAARQKLLLIFGAVDESAWVYVNGQLVGEHDIGEPGWNERFECDVTKHLRPGERNLIAVKVLDRQQYGGIWKSVKLAAPRQGAPPSSERGK